MKFTCSETKPSYNFSMKISLNLLNYIVESEFTLAKGHLLPVSIESHIESLL
jgi:hypothetical protein